MKKINNLPGCPEDITLRILTMWSDGYFTLAIELFKEHYVRHLNKQPRVRIKPKDIWYKNRIVKMLKIF